MKVLKSGIELDPSKLNKLRGGACACGCGIGFNGDQLVYGGEAGDDCRCGCFGKEAAVDNSDGAINQL